MAMAAIGYGLGGITLLALLFTAAAGRLLMAPELMYSALGLLGALIVPLGAMAAVGTRRLGRVKLLSDIHKHDKE